MHARALLIRTSIPALLLLHGAALAGTGPRGEAPAWRWVDPDGLGVATRVELADVNDDGRLDLLVADAGADLGAAAGRVRVFFGGAALSATPDLTLGDVAGEGGTSASPGSWGDLNGDGAADQLTWLGDPASRARTLQARLGAPAGPDPMARTTTIADAAVAFRWGLPVPTGPMADVNGDGFADALLVAYEQGSLEGPLQHELHLGSRAGITASAAWRWVIDTPGLIEATSVVVGDLDGDGHRELVTVELDDIDGVAIGAISVTRGDPAGLRPGGYWTSMLLPSGVSRASGFAAQDVGDLTGDGLDDVMVLARPDDPQAPAEALLFPGSVNYGFATNAPITMWSEVVDGMPWLIGAGDVDGSALPDLAIGLPAAPGAGDGTGAVLLLRDAGVSFTPIERTLLAAAGERGFGAHGAIGDVDGDGLDDLVVVESGDATTAGAVSLFLGFPDADADDWDDRGADCDPTDDDVNPGATETWYDGVDQDCDGDDADQDADGADAETAGGDDCDDLDPDVGPDAVDLPGDGIDQDCDGADANDGAPEITDTTGCGCAHRAPPAPTALGLALLLLARRRAR